MKTLKFLFTAFSITALFTACNDDDPAAYIAPINEEEVITTINATLAPQTAGATINLSFRDLDGDGPAEPQITVSGNLQANTVYDGSLDLLNEAATPPESISEEILAEGLDHQFFFLSSNNLLGFAYAAPFDLNSAPIGLQFTLTTNMAGTGSFTVILRHQPDKAASGVASGDVTNAGGETDVQVTFPITVE